MFIHLDHSPFTYRLIISLNFTVCRRLTSIFSPPFNSSNKPLILKSLNALEERLDPKTFFRANRKHIVNLRMIDKIEPYFNGGLLLELKGGEKIEVSRRQTVKFKEMMSL